MIVLDSISVPGAQFQVSGYEGVGVVSIYLDNKIVGGVALTNDQMITVRDYLTALIDGDQ